ncbi:MAG: hypothetical protein KatS3mg068_1404 [Candidatus Sericytochromatia bacterium]|nr:MAG: hypothetical protein KatS3mg068_1404 [Candidatus Sericytochromatia bacterium]
MKKFFLCIIFLFLLQKNSYSQDLPIHIAEEIKEKNYSINLLYADSYSVETKVAGGEYRFEIKVNFLEKGNGFISELYIQHLSGFNPAIISGIVPWGETAHSHDIGGLLGYRFNLNSFGISPYIKGRGFITRGRGGDNIYGPEFGLNFEWKIYPEITHLNVKYGLMIPLIHRYTGETDIVQAHSFLLNSFDIRLSYRFLENWDAITGFQLRQLPKYLGNSNLVTKDILQWNSFLLGIAYLF